MSAEAVKDGAIELGAQLAAIETVLGRVMVAVMTAATHHSAAAAEPIQADIDRLDDMVTALSVEARRFRKALRS